ncbi:hypothetical protein Tco_0004743, partial [Tanacetum coccineum]
QYAVLILQNTPYCLEEQIRCLDRRDQYAVLSGRVDTSYPTGGYDVSVDLKWISSKRQKTKPNDKNWHDEKTVQNHGQVRKLPKSESILKNQQSNQCRN